MLGHGRTFLENASVDEAKGKKNTNLMVAQSSRIEVDATGAFLHYKLSVLHYEASGDLRKMFFLSEWPMLPFS